MEENSDKVKHVGGDDGDNPIAFTGWNITFRRISLTRSRPVQTTVGKWKARYKGDGVRGSGKSHGFAEMLIIRATLRAQPRRPCPRSSKEPGKIPVKLLAEDKIKALGVPHHFRFWTQIRNPGGGVIIFRGMQNHSRFHQVAGRF